MARFLKGERVELLMDGAVCLAGSVSFVWRCADSSGRRSFRYDVAGSTEGIDWKITKVPQENLQRPYSGRGKKLVLRSHSRNKRRAEYAASRIETVEQAAEWLAERLVMNDWERGRILDDRAFYLRASRTFVRSSAPERNAGAAAEWNDFEGARKLLDGHHMAKLSA